METKVLEKRESILLGLAGPVAFCVPFPALPATGSLKLPVAEAAPALYAGEQERLRREENRRAAEAATLRRYYRASGKPMHNYD